MVDSSGIHWSTINLIGVYDKKFRQSLLGCVNQVGWEGRGLYALGRDAYKCLLENLKDRYR
jgi:hypothetical protein